MISELARQKAAQAWCRKSTSKKTMDTELAIAFAEIIDEIWNKPWLGNATTGELFDEIIARIVKEGLRYKTADCKG